MGLRISRTSRVYRVLDLGFGFRVRAATLSASYMVVARRGLEGVSRPGMPGGSSQSPLSPFTVIP